MKKTGVMQLLSQALNGHIKDGRSAGIGENHMSVKIIDNDGKQFLIKVEEIKE